MEEESFMALQEKCPKSKMIRTLLPEGNNSLEEVLRQQAKLLGFPLPQDFSIRSPSNLNETQETLQMVATSLNISVHLLASSGITIYGNPERRSFFVATCLVTVEDKEERKFFSVEDRLDFTSQHFEPCYEKLTQLHEAVATLSSKSFGDPTYTQDFIPSLRKLSSLLPDPSHPVNSWSGPNVIRVGFVGESQDGKSSFINALLGEQVSSGTKKKLASILPVGVGHQSCTTVALEMKWAPRDDFLVEIDILTEEELVSIFQVDHHNADEPNASQEAEPKKKKKMEEAIKKAKEMPEFQDDRGRSFLHFAQNLENLPVFLKKALKSEPFSPVVKKFQISGPFRLLPVGVVLVDCPGLNDKTARNEALARKILSSCNIRVVVTCHPHRDSVKKLIETAFLISFPRSVIAVVSKIDSNSDHWLEDEENSPLEKIVHKVIFTASASIKSNFLDHLKQLRDSLDDFQGDPLELCTKISFGAISSKIYEKIFNSARFVPNSDYDDVELNDENYSGVPEMRHILLFEPFLLLSQNIDSTLESIKNLIRRRAENFFGNPEQQENPPGIEESQVREIFMPSFHTFEQKIDDFKSFLDRCRPLSKTWAEKASIEGKWWELHSRTWEAAADSWRRGIFTSRGRVRQNINFHRDVSTQIEKVVSIWAHNHLFSSFETLSRAFSREKLDILFEGLDPQGDLVEKIYNSFSQFNRLTMVSLGMFYGEKIYDLVRENFLPFFSFGHSKGETLKHVEEVIIPGVISILVKELSTLKVRLEEFQNQLWDIFSKVPVSLVSRDNFMEQMANIVEAFGQFPNLDADSIGVSRFGNFIPIEEKAEDRKTWIGSLYSHHYEEFNDRDALSGLRSDDFENRLAQIRDVLNPFDYVNLPYRRTDDKFRDFRMAVKDLLNMTEEEQKMIAFVIFHDQAGRTEGIDQGGITAEYLTYLAELFSTYVFREESDARNYLIPDALAPSEHSYYEAFGRFLARVLRANVKVPLNLSLAFYYILSATPLTSSEVSLVNPSFGNLIEEGRKSPENIPAFALNFSASKWIPEMELPIGLPWSHGGDPEGDGTEIEVTKELFEDYVELASSFYLFRSTRKSWYHILKGISSSLHLPVLSMFSPLELMHIFEGIEKITSESLLSRLNFVPSENNQGNNQVRWVTEIIQEMSSEDCILFLQFVTSKVRLSSDTIINIEIDEELNPAGLPLSHTCVPSLHIPLYPSKEKTRQLLYYAIREGNAGFSLA